MSDKHVPFIVRGVPRNPPSMRFDAGTTYAAAKAAFEAAHPDYVMDEAFTFWETSTPDINGDRVVVDEDAGIFCEACDHFIAPTEPRLINSDDGIAFCQACNAKWLSEHAEE